MRNTTFIALKLLGLLSLYWAIENMVYIGTSVTSFIHAGPSPYLSWALAVWLLLLVMVSVFPFILLARTDWILAKLNLPPEHSPAIAPIEPSQLLRTGLILVGAFTVVDALPAIVSTVSTYLMSTPPRSPFGSYHAWQVIPPVLKFILGWIVIGRSERFAQSAFPPPQEEGN